MAMKKRATPRENWENVVSVPREIFKDADYQQILQKLKIPFTDETVKKIIDAQIEYYAKIRLINDAPRVSEICATMKRLIKYGEKYQECLEKMNDKSREKLIVVLPTPFEVWELLDRSLSDVIIITGRAKHVLEDWEQFKKTHKIGAPFDYSLRSYIQALLEIYESVTGKKATVTKDPYSTTQRFRGPFMQFLTYCFEKVPGHPRLSNSALAKAIERVRSNPLIRILNQGSFQTGI
jgi:hypothetical protein